MSATWGEKHPVAHRGIAAGTRAKADPSFAAFWILRIGFVVLPALMGLDKFTNLMAYWPDYLAGWISAMLPFTAQTAMYAVGAVEIIAAIGIAAKPRYASYVVALWLVGIIVNLASMGTYLDIALRDVGLLVAALALSRLAAQYDKPRGAS